MAEPTEPNPSSPLPPNASEQRILLVEDHAQMRRAIRRLIEREGGYAVCAEAETAGEALEAAGALRPKLAVVDLSLPDFSGLELTKRLRAGHPELLILVLSVHKEDIYRDPALAAGANGYLMKDEAPEKLGDALACLCAGKVYWGGRMPKPGSKIPWPKKGEGPERIRE